MTSADGFIEAIAERVVERLREEGALNTATAPPGVRLLDVTQAAARMNRSPSLVRQMAATGEIPKHVIKRVGRRVMFKSEELDKWLQES